MRTQSLEPVERQNTDAERELKARKDWLCEGKVKGL